MTTYRITFNGIVVGDQNNFFATAEEAKHYFHKVMTKLPGEYGIIKIIKKELKWSRAYPLK